MEKPAYVPMFENVFMALDCLDDQELRQALDMIRAYYFDGEEPPEGRSPAKAMFMVVRATLDKTMERNKTNRSNAKRRAKTESESPDTQCEPERSKPNRSEILANARKNAMSSGEPERVEANASEPERTEANASEGERIGANASEPERTRANASESERIGANEDKKNKSKKKSKSKKEDLKSVAHARATPPPPLRAKFEPPTVEDVNAYAMAYAASKGFKLADLKFDPERYVDHFTSNGWKVSGKAPMRDWHGSVRNWMKNDNPQLEGGAATDDWATKYVPEAIVVD